LAFTLPVAGGRFFGNAWAFDKIYPAGSIRSVDLASCGNGKQPIEPVEELNWAPLASSAP
jgi:hypothetical protein